MPIQYGNKRRVPATAVLGGRGALAYVDDVAIMVTNVEKWKDADVIQLLEESAHLGGRITAPAAVTHFFGETLGGAASQRKMIVDWMKDNDIEPTPRTLTITDSALMRAALMAYSWLTKTEMKAFSSTDMKAAYIWVTRDLDTNPEDVKVAVESCYKLLGKIV